MKLPISKLVNNTGQIEGLPANPRTINKDDYQKLLKSLQEDPDFLNHKPLHVYEHNDKYVVLGGNQRLKALKELGHKDVPVTIYDPETPVEVLKRRVIVDNSTFGDYDMDLLANEWDIEEVGRWGLEPPDMWESETQLKEENTTKDPSNLYKLNLDIAKFEAKNGFDIPIIKKSTSIPKNLERFNGLENMKDFKVGSAVHFFAQDYKFESLWTNPYHCLDEIKRLGLILSPDFSFPDNAPVPVQMWQTYRNRWLGAWWNSHGIEVIPTVGWNDDIFDFCFLGIEKGSNVAISGVGVKSPVIFREGFKKMCDIINPKNIICYGSIDRFDIIDTRIVNYPTRWEGINKKGKESNG